MDQNLRIHGQLRNANYTKRGTAHLGTPPPLPLCPFRRGPTHKTHRNAAFGRFLAEWRRSRGSGGSRNEALGNLTPQAVASIRADRPRERERERERSKGHRQHLHPTRTKDHTYVRGVNPCISSQSKAPYLSSWPRALSMLSRQPRLFVSERLTRSTQNPRRGEGRKYNTEPCGGRPFHGQVTVNTPLRPVSSMDCTRILKKYALFLVSSDMNDDSFCQAQTMLAPAGRYRVNRGWERRQTFCIRRPAKSLPLTQNTISRVDALPRAVSYAVLNLRISTIL